MYKLRFILLILSVPAFLGSYGQVDWQEKQNCNYFSRSAIIYQTDTGKLLINLYRTTCKGYVYLSGSVAEEPDIITGTLNAGKTPATLSPPEKPRTKFLTIHGNIYYNFSYRSYIDTPFAQKDVMQHLVRTNLDLLIDGKYPLKLTLTNRTSNSPYFKDGTDLNFQSGRKQTLENIKAELLAKVNSYNKLYKLSYDESVYENKLKQVQQLQEWINSPARMQELVEEKERAFENSINKLSKKADADNTEAGELLNKKHLLGTKDFSKFKAKKLIENKIRDQADSLATDSMLLVKDSSFSDKLQAGKQKLQKMQTELKQYQTKAVTAKKNVQDSINKVKSEINSLNSSKGLYDFMQKNGIAKNELTGAQRFLLSVNQFNVGRSWLDYSELTVKNVSLSGVNIEMNPLPFYFAVAAGKINYRFRDFVFKDNINTPAQSLYLVRAGMGQKEKNNFIITFYNGKKAVLKNTVPGASNSLQRVLGISAETRLAINENNYIVAEVAKSSYNNNGNTQPHSSDLLSKTLNWKTKTNLAYSLKLFCNSQQTDTKVTAYYRKTGEDFQSFNLYPVHVNQDAWMARIVKGFWKRKFTIDAAIRKNDFESPVASPSFESKTIFKSLQLTLRVPKYPFVSVGYYPSSQLSLSNNNVLVENQYNTLNAVVSHNYHINKVLFNTNAVYTQFFNNSTDTGFIYYNSSSYTLNHSIFLNPLVLGSSVSLTDQQDLNLFSLEQSLSYQFKNRLTLSGSLKWNRVNKAEDLVGCSVAAGIYLKRIGTIQINYDKTFLPGYNRTLMPVDIGRVSFYKEF
ncbi:MAG: hypothetical protein ABIN74_09320 [Ferruginibacter sp.]